MMQSNETPKLYLIDGLNVAYRLYFALVNTKMKNSNNFPTWAIHGFMTQLFLLIKKYHPTHLAVAFDNKEKTFRHDLYSEYKAHREIPPDDFIIQLEKIKEILTTYNIKQISLLNYEADDIIGTLAETYKKTCEIFIVSTDKDFFQLVDDRVKICKTNRKQIFEIFDTSHVLETYNISPRQFIDYLALTGDTSDNIPGVKNIGPKKASSLLNKYDALKNILVNIQHEPQSVQKAFATTSDKNIFLSKKLATIERHAPLKISLDDLTFQEPDYKKSGKLLQELELKNLLLQSKSLYKEAFDLEIDLFSGSEDSPNSSTSSKKLEGNVVTIDNESSLKSLVKKLSKSGAFAFDTETTSLDILEAEIICLSFCFDGETGYVVHLPSFSSASSVFEILKPVFEKEKILKIGQNLKFDIGILLNHGLKVKGNLFDTMIVSYILSPDSRRHNLKDIAADLLSIEATEFKDLVGKKTIHDIPENILIDYSAEDAVITFKVYKVLSSQLNKEKALKKVCNDIEFPLLRVLLQMENDGVAIDTSILQALSEKFSLTIKQTLKAIYEIAGEEFNADSPSQLSEILFNKLGIPAKKKTKTGYSTNFQALESLENDFPIVKEILKYRSLKKLTSTYIDKLPTLVSPKTGLIHTSFNQTTASTGRISSSNPNLQNIPIRTSEGRSIRRAFVSRNKKERTIISADYSQIELRIAAELSQDPGMIDAFRNNEDIHATTASSIFHTSTPTREMRDQAKAINFGVLYGMESFSLSKRLNLPNSEAKRMINDYKKKYKTFFEFIKKTIAVAKEKGFVETLIGRKRYIENLNSSSFSLRHAAERVATNTTVQGTAADLIKVAMIAISRRMTKEKFLSQMILQVHDELVFDAMKSELKDLSKLIELEMINASRTIGVVHVPIIVEINHGDNWLDAH